jgi:hypothetical protein
VSEHAAEYVRTRTPTGTLSRNVDLVQEALDRRTAEGWTLVSAIADTDNGDTTGVLLLFRR